MKKLLLALLFMLGCQAAQAQAVLRASDAYNYLQGQRARVRTVVGEADKPAPDSLRKGIRMLQEALAYYQRPEIQALAKTSQSLYYRKSDITFDMAILQGQLGQPEAAAASLQQLLTPETAQVYAPWIIKEPALAAARQSPPLKAALEEAMALNNVFNSKALATPYQPNLSPAEKAAGLSKMWMEAKYNFAYFDHIPTVDWDQTYLNYLARVQATPSTLAYFRVLQEFYAQLHDGHTGVWATDGPLADSVYGRPPFLAELVAGRVLVQLVRHDSLQRTGISSGLEIVRVDGLPVVEYANRYVRPYQSGSTPQNVDVQTYTYNLLRGPKSRPVRVEFRDARGRSFARVLPRSGYGKIKPIAPAQLRFLPGNVAYLQVNEFETDAGFRRFVAAFDSIKRTNALIIDLRQNGGGNSSNGSRILNYLTDKPYLLGRYASRTYSAVGRARGDGVQFEPVDTANYSSPAGGSNYYAKPVAVLIGGATFSAAEDFCAAYVGLKRGPLVGEPTGGSTGQPLSFALPGGIMARVCTKRDMYPDGTEWNGKGIMPTVLVRPTVAELAAGHDPVLAAALRQLHAPTAAADAAKPLRRKK
ncbi:S41 family peptidase [Hymenobacter sp. DH14]|uniref:S41 family peptidase n=1 Tax=Hymenobacter cyanobacteriorum TaxID=2926463 RepID=A0A9X2ADM7_9BACT|nr:S41 family peptidase [Hymenobacter cyanobacteriorum]MCI1186291.1 S41 family peptidase [Hymenobacter cyanobacteriorum]